MIVVKVGGSLYDHPGLGPGLSEFLTPFLHRGPVLVVPGGGKFADTIRTLDQLHALGEEKSHWLALRSLSTAALFLNSIVPTAKGLTIFDPYDFARTDDSLPHSWDATSDSLAARVAIVKRADRLVLLKSIEIPPETPWSLAAERGWVDLHFPTVVAGHVLKIEPLNFRRWLADRSPPPK